MLPLMVAAFTGTATEARFGTIDLWARLAQLAERGFAPHHILDIGANRGDWTRGAQRIWPHAKIFMIEANPAHAARLNEMKVPYAISVLGDAERDVTMHFGDMGVADTGNSIFRETTNQQLFKGSVVRMRTLDDVLISANRSHTRYPLMKVDVQGAELLVLDGAVRTLRSVEVILLELAVVQFNEGAPMWLTVQTKLARLGFQIYDVLELHYLPTTGMLIQVDLMLVKMSSTLWARRATGYPEPNWPTTATAESG